MTENLARGADTEETKSFKGVWGLSSDPRLIIPPAVLNETAATVGPKSDRGGGPQRSEKQYPARFATTQRRRHLVCACHTKKKNVCRVHGISRQDVLLLDRFTNLVSYWVRTEDKDRLESCLSYFFLEDEAWGEMERNKVPWATFAVPRHGFMCAGLSAKSS